MNLPFLFTCMLIVALSLLAVPAQARDISEEQAATALEKRAEPTAERPDVFISAPSSVGLAAERAEGDEHDAAAKGGAEQHGTVVDHRFESLMLFLQILRGAK